MGRIYKDGVYYGDTNVSVKYYDNPQDYYDLPESEREAMTELVILNDDDNPLDASNITYGNGSNVNDKLNTITSDISTLNSTMSGLIKTATETVTTAYYGQVSLSLPESKKLISAKSNNNVLVFPYKAGEYWGLYCSTVIIFPQKLDEGTSITVTYSYID